MNQIQNQIHSKQRAVSTNLTQIPQKNIVEYPKNINKNSSKRATSREEHKIPQSRYNSFTNRGLEFVQKVENPIGKNIRCFPSAMMEYMPEESPCQQEI